MRIALDARTIYRPVRRGTGKNLIDLYRRVATMRPDWDIIAYHREAGPVEDVLPFPNVTPSPIEMPGDRFNAWQRYRLPLAAKQDGADVLHCPANESPSWWLLPTLVTIHDLIPIDMPEGRRAVDVKRFEQCVRTACTKADGIICPSHYTASRLVREYHADESRITVNHWAADSSVRPIEERHWQPVLSKYNIDAPYALHFGAPAPRKNTKRTLEAWAMLKPATRNAWRLVVVGLDGDSRSNMQTIVDRLGIGNTVRLYGFADEADLPVLLSAATVLAFPSLSEGFGLPILDAWATGAAVLTGDGTSLPEVGGDGAQYVDASNPGSIAKGMHRLLVDPIYRRDMVQRGHRRLQLFNWTATARRFIGAVEKLAPAQPGAIRAAA